MSPQLTSKMRIVRFADSDVISEARYDLYTRQLRLRFPKTKSTWEYDNVEVADFGALVMAQSPGELFNKRIRDKYNAKRILPPPGRSG